MSESIPTHIPNIDSKAMPIESYLLFRSLVQWQMLTRQWFNNKSKSVGVGVRKVKAAVVEEVFHQRFHNGENCYHALPGNKKTAITGN